MKYALQVFALVAGVGTPVHSSTVEADDDHAAVDLARATHTPPDAGGEFEMVVSSLETMTIKGWVATPAPSGSFVNQTRSPCEICRFKVQHQPRAHLREAHDEALASRELLEKRAKLKAEIRAEVLEEIAAEGKVSK